MDNFDIMEEGTSKGVVVALAVDLLTGGLSVTFSIVALKLLELPNRFSKPLNIWYNNGQKNI